MNDKQKQRWDLLVRDCRDSYYNHINVGGKFTRSVIIAADEILQHYFESNAGRKEPIREEEQK
jgi:hypothetical protein